MKFSLLYSLDPSKIIDCKCTSTHWSRPIISIKLNDCIDDLKTDHNINNIDKTRLSSIVYFLLNRDFL